MAGADNRLRNTLLALAAVSTGGAALAGIRDYYKRNKYDNYSPAVDEYSEYLSETAKPTKKQGQGDSKNNKETGSTKKSSFTKFSDSWYDTATSEKLWNPVTTAALLGLGGAGTYSLLSNYLDKRRRAESRKKSLEAEAELARLSNSIMEDDERGVTKGASSAAWIEALKRTNKPVLKQLNKAFNVFRTFRNSVNKGLGLKNKQFNKGLAVLGAGALGGVGYLNRDSIGDGVNSVAAGAVDSIMPFIAVPGAAGLLGGYLMTRGSYDDEKKKEVAKNLKKRIEQGREEEILEDSI